MLRKRLLPLIVLALLPLLFVSQDAQADPQSSIKLNYATFDPIIEGEPVIARSQRAAETSNYRILQLVDTPHSSTIAELRELGIEFLDIIPTNAYVVRLNGTSRSALTAHPAVRWLGALHPAYKISTDATGGEMKVMLFPDSDVDAVAAEAEAAGGTVTTKVDNDYGQQLVVEISAENLAALAAIDDVLWVENTAEYHTFNDSARSVVQAGAFGERLVLYENGLTGAGQVAALGDSGLDGGFDAVTNQSRPGDGSCYFAEEDGNGGFAAYGLNHRKIVGYNGAITPGGSDGQDENGHGTHVAGSIAGDQPPYGVVSPNDGQAYDARLYFHDLNDDGSSSIFVPPDLRDMYGDAYDVNKNGTFELAIDARIHSNSWGSPVNTYNGNAFETDDFLWNHPDMVILFAAGNQGPAPGTIGSPAIGKNMVTVGMTENGAAANDQNALSSHGPVAPSGRLKPDVSAPGGGVVSALFNDLCGTQSLTGTSMATPTTAGIAAQMLEYFHDGYYPHGHANSGAPVHPSGMLVKNMLINSSRRITGLNTDNQGATGAWPSNGQGWGRIAANDALYFPGDQRDLWFADVYSLDGSVGLDDETNSTMTYTLNVTGEEPLKVSLVWYDTASSLLVGFAGDGIINNDLDLTVTGPDGSVNGNDTLGNDFTPNNELNVVGTDTVNNIEMVYLENPTPGVYTIEVEMSFMSSTDGRKQPFAVVATGDFNSSNGQAEIEFDSYDPTPTTAARLQVRDLDLNTTAGIDTVSVVVTSTTHITPVNILLTETGDATATFEGTVTLFAEGETNEGVNTGELAVNEGDVVRLSYDDQSDALGNFHQAFDTAEITPALITQLNPPEVDAPDNTDGDGEYTVMWSAAETTNPWDEVTKEIAYYIIEEATDYQSLFTNTGSTTGWTASGGLPGTSRWRTDNVYGAQSGTPSLRGGPPEAVVLGLTAQLTLNNEITVPNASGSVRFGFWTRFFNDPSDTGRIDISDDNGATWTPLYTVTRSPLVQPTDLRMQYEEYDLSSYKGKSVRLRLHYDTGGTLFFTHPAPQGFYVDDIILDMATWSIAQPAPLPGSGGPPGSITSDLEFTLSNQATGTYFHRVQAIYADGTASGWSNVVEVEVTDGAADPVSMSINDVTVDEGVGSADLTVTLSETTTEDVTVDFTTVEAGSATSDDFEATSGTLTIPTGQITGTISVTITNDTIHEADEAFSVELSNASSNAQITDNTGVVTITDNDGPPTMSIEDEAIDEDAGSVTLTVTLSAESSFPISATFTTQDGTATSGDYVANSGTVEFAAGEMSQTVDVSISPDNVDEDDETFTVELANPSNATIADGSATVTIRDVTDAPTLSVADVTVNEDVGTATITVTMTGSTELTPTVMYATSDGSALDGSDYNATSGTLTFDDGNTETFTVNIINDTDDENTELFNVMLSNAMDATIDDGSAEIRINDDDDGDYELRVGDVTINENATTASVTVTLSAPPLSGPITVDYATSDGTATAGDDYTATSGTLTFPTGDNTTQMITVDISEDALDEMDETIFVTLSNATGSDNPTIADDQGVIIILDNDDAPFISIDDVSAEEASGTMTFTVSIDPVSSMPVSVNYATSDNSALASEDYESDSGSVMIPAGETTAEVVITLKDDTRNEDTERFFVTLSSANNGMIDDNQGIGTITDLDPVPSLAISDAVVSEGVITATVVVTLSAESSFDVTVDYATDDSTRAGATPGSDYTPISGTITIPAGATMATVSVEINDDNENNEGDETFSINFSNPTRATLDPNDSSATVTISDNEIPTAVTLQTLESTTGTLWWLPLAALLMTATLLIARRRGMKNS